MKAIFIFLAATLISMAARVQNNDHYLNHYLQVKDALVHSDRQEAGLQAIALESAIKAKAPFEGRNALLKSVQKMVKATDLEKQRTAFAEVSVLMWKAVQQDSALSRNVYYLYCPMKKAYWLSAEPAIKNPYYGSRMLSCGSVSDQKTN